ncbi:MULTISPECIES: hypothetical protein [unclassified Coleofasciculus]|uniref:hypothetical protein n=1 Tax=unclassified Coleofasciculus TaxID=2692782 RepID=UPI0018802654|nr:MULTISPECIES: hypothetical protein [unclassified Coleofasciculus]MBE9128635.1 hypothetical protein [Coleofasciculus sp. LEGE 07081]MBE9147259.1 hypothetical protein [Coleofasciculus sp. LEGE 07092]
MKNKLSVKILKEGDQILNVWPSGADIYIAVRSRNEEVFVYSVTQDQNGQPKLSKAPEITITHGDGEVEAWGTDASGKQIFSLTA